jgi:hypothetical protein
LAHLAGVVVAIVLLVRQRERSLAPILAVAGFALLLLTDLATFAQGPLINLISHRTAAGFRLVVTGVGCCCSVVDVAAIACLIVALAQALSSPKPEGAETQP